MTAALSLALAGLWLVLVCLFVGVGALVLGERAQLEDGWPAAHAAFWIGLGTVTCALLAWHLVLPVDGWSFGLFVVVGLTGLLVRRRQLASCLRAPRPWLAALAVAVAAIWVANHALDVPAIDDYLYEFQAIRWNHDYPIVPGLANLHGRLGFNQSHHLLGAMLSVGPLAGRVNHVINGLFVVVTIAYLGGGLARLLRRGATGPGSCLLRALLLGPAIGLALFSVIGSTISTLKADVIVTSTTIVIVCLLAELAETTQGTGRFVRTATALLVTCAFLLSVKLSALVFGAVVGLSVCARLWQDARRLGRRVPAPIRAGLLVAALTAALVPLRGVVLSGYPAYPLTVLGVPVDWRVSPAQADAERAIITSWARVRPTYDPAEVAGWAWVPNWARDVVLGSQFALVLPLTLTLMCWAASLTNRRRHRGPPAADLTESRLPVWAYGTVLTACGSAIAVWWLEAPSSRFSVGLFWGLAAVSLVRSVERQAWSDRAGVAAAAIIGAALLVVALGVVGGQPGWLGVMLLMTGASVWMAAFGTFGRRSRLAVGILCALLAFAEGADRIASYVVHGHGDDARAVVWLTPDDYMDGRPDRYSLVPRRTLSGLTVYVTSSTKYETPLPNTRYFNPYLEQRRAGLLSSGFRARFPVGLGGYGYALDMTGRRRASTR